MKVAMKNVYIDLGANVGNTVCAFLQENPGFMAFAFEPNMKLIPLIHEKSLKIGRDICVIWGAAWISDGTISLFQSEHASASTVVPGKVAYVDRGWSPINYDRPHPTPSIDFSRWLLANFSREDHIVVKMDIEGAEYKVLEKMLSNGALSLVNQLRCEWHYDRFPEITKAYHDKIYAKVSAVVDLVDWT
jgi:FkbM family methyltransferase